MSAYSLAPRDPELVIGLVGALGVELDLVEKALEIALAEIQYNIERIKITEIFSHINLEAIQKKGEVIQKEGEILQGEPAKKYSKKMNDGNFIRQRTKMPDALAILAIHRVKEYRLQRNKELSKQEKHDSSVPLKRQAYIINQLKRPEEVETLRQVYGDSFILISAYSSRDRRNQYLAKRFNREGGYKSIDDACPDVMTLINRDEADKDIIFGQAVGNAFPLADVFVDADRDNVTSETKRAIHALFGEPTVTPSREEYAMFMAHGAAMRSADLGRQVGAAISTQEGQILALGTNEVAKAEGGLYWTGDSPDMRDIFYQDGSDTNTEEKTKILSEIFEVLKREKWLSTKRLKEETHELATAVGGFLKNSRVMSLIEFLRPVHGEMAALMDAARSGIAVDGCTMYVTTFPCHECAKHIVASGIRKVVFIEPYPKSRVVNMFSDSISVNHDGETKKIPFEQFVGIAPRRYQDIFAISGKQLDHCGNVIIDGRRDGQKQILQWEKVKSQSQPKVAGHYRLYVHNEDALDRNLYEQLKSQDLIRQIKTKKQAAKKSLKSAKVKRTMVDKNPIKNKKGVR